MHGSRIPFLLLSILLIVTIGKVLIVYALQWMLDAGIVRNVTYNPYGPSDIAETPEIILALANLWDSHHFIQIARSGYPLGVENDLLFAFAPVYPALIALVNGYVGNLYLSSIIVSNAFYLPAVYGFYKVARLYMDYEMACFSAMLFGLFPTFLVYGTAAYSEAPYLFFAIFSWYFFKKENYFPCSVFTTLAILTRYISGILLVIYGLIELSKLIDKWREEKSFMKAFNLKLLWFAIPVVSIAAFFTYLWTLTGNFLVAFDSHVFFGDSLTTPLHQFRWFFEGFFTQINSIEPLQLVLLRYSFTIPFLMLAISVARDDRELGMYGIVFMWLTLSMEGISGIAGPRIMLSAWVALLAFKHKSDKGFLFALASLFVIVGIWVLYQFETSFFA